MATLDVITLPEAKTALNLSGTAAYDAELPVWITTVSARLDSLVGPVVVRTLTGELHDGGEHCVYLRYYPVSAITSVTEYDDVTPTSLTAETNASKPAAAYLAGRYRRDPTLMSQRIRRRSSGTDDTFPSGRQNVAVTYSAGRAANTAAVAERYKTAAELMLINLWRSQQDSVAGVGEYDVPQGIFPTFAVPRAVKELLYGEIQEPRPMVAK